METQSFEQRLIQMSKPEVSQLKHEDMLAEAITKAKDKSVVSWWWLSIPLYILAALLMKTFFMPGTTLLSNMHELTKKNPYTSVLFFFILPVVFILINVDSIRKVYRMTGGMPLLKSIWFNLLIMLISILVIALYFT